MKSLPPSVKPATVNDSPKILTLEAPITPLEILTGSEEIGNEFKCPRADFGMISPEHKHQRDIVLRKIAEVDRAIYEARVRKSEKRNKKKSKQAQLNEVIKFSENIKRDYHTFLKAVDDSFTYRFVMYYSWYCLDDSNLQKGVPTPQNERKIITGVTTTNAHTVAASLGIEIGASAGVNVGVVSASVSTKITAALSYSYSHSKTWNTEEHNTFKLPAMTPQKDSRYLYWQRDIRYKLQHKQDLNAPQMFWSFNSNDIVHENKFDWTDIGKGENKYLILRTNKTDYQIFPPIEGNVE